MVCCKNTSKSNNTKILNDKRVWLDIKCNGDQIIFSRVKEIQTMTIVFYKYNINYYKYLRRIYSLPVWPTLIKYFFRIGFKTSWRNKCWSPKGSFIYERCQLSLQIKYNMFDNFVNTRTRVSLYDILPYWIL